MTCKTRRNARGLGSIRQRPDGRWEGRLTIGKDPGTGKQVQRSVYGDTQKEVLQALQKLAVERDTGVYTAPTKITVKQWLEIWLDEYTGGVKSSTKISYRQHAQNHIIPALGAVKLSALKAPAVQKFYNGLQRRERPLSSKTVKNIHGVLHQALKQAVRLGYIPANPTEACTLPRIEKAEIAPLDAAEIKAFLAALDDSEYSTLLKVDLFTGMREGEILGLQWVCVDFERGVIRVDKQLTRPRVKGDAYRFTSLKNDKPRTIKPAPYVMELLREHRKRQLEKRLRAGDLWDEGDFPDLVFTGDTGKHLCYNVILRHYRQALKAAGLPEKRFHDLRHTYAVASLRAGDDIKTVQENLGHHTAAFTLDQYGHVTGDMRDESSRRMQRFIDGLK